MAAYSIPTIQGKKRYPVKKTKLSAEQKKLREFLRTHDLVFDGYNKNGEPEIKIIDK